MNVCVNVGFNSVYRSCIVVGVWSAKVRICLRMQIIMHLLVLLDPVKNEHLVPSFCVQLT